MKINTQAGPLETILDAFKAVSMKYGMTSTEQRAFLAGSIALSLSTKALAQFGPGQRGWDELVRWAQRPAAILRGSGVTPDQMKALVLHEVFLLFMTSTQTLGIDDSLDALGMTESAKDAGLAGNSSATNP